MCFLVGSPGGGAALDGNSSGPVEMTAEPRVGSGTDASRKDSPKELNKRLDANTSGPQEGLKPSP